MDFFIEEIKNQYKKVGLTVEKITKAKLGDGYYVYHPFGSVNTRYKYEVVAKTKNTITKQRTKYLVYSDFIAIDNGMEGFRFSLKMNIRHALIRKEEIK